ncbi:DNA helicase RecQ [Candidatus Marinamargulisbacteria bacterium SCGC AG-343-D04]|nr:DNA helicase RecQ [Candidatus Marinamargulisbacteria bacterium SCGC AG-343-D04]
MIHELLKSVFGYDSFRPLQESIIQRTLDGQDSVVIMPTGGGKSLCYQIPALALEGCAVVISPLISLMQDQVLSLQQLGVQAMLWNSTLNAAEVREVRQHLESGQLKLLYISPERLNLDDFLSVLKECHISFFAIDEAHCISEWGHDFRPGYRSLSLIKEHFSEKPVMALTATATDQVIHDIKTQLVLETSKVFKASFNRPNLFYEVKRKKNTFKELLRFLESRKDQSGIIYCQSRKNVETIAEKLIQQGFSAKAYHAGLSNDEREKNQNDFIHDDTPIIVATIAFGMGIDKSNVRYVVHYDLPKTIENYYQETGRAGRDGVDSHCLLFFSYADRFKLEHFMHEISDMNERKRCIKKLNQMIDFAAKPRCRRQQLLNYFGEEHSASCDFCDICKNPPQEKDITIVSQKVLSCIYRVRQNYGVTMIIDVLRGTMNDKIRYLNFDKLSTFGIEKELSKAELHDVVQHLIYLRLIAIQGFDYPVLKLTEKAGPVLRSEERLFMPVFERPKTVKQKKMSKNREIVHEDEGLFSLLKQKRKDMATTLRLPAYMIFHDKTLQEIASIKPSSMAELMTVSGVGLKKAQRFGEDFLEVVRGGN